MTGKIFSRWDETHSELWSHQPIRLEHQMHKSPAFSMDDLAQLIESYPREHYSLVKTGARESGRVWREGDIGNLSGRQVIEAISRGGLWLNMRNVGAVEAGFASDRSSSRRSRPRFLVSCAEPPAASDLSPTRRFISCRSAGAGADPMPPQRRSTLPNTARLSAAALEDSSAFRRRVDLLRALVRRSREVSTSNRPDLNWPEPPRVENSALSTFR